MKLRIPKSWREVSVRQYTDLMHLYSSQLSDIEKDYSTISILCNEKIEDINKCNLTDLADVFRKMEFLRTIPSGEVNEVIEIDGNIFEMTNPSEMTAGQFIDLQNLDYSKDIDKVASIIYSGRSYEGFHNIALFQSANIEEIYSATVFFCEASKKWLRDTRAFLEAKTAKINIHGSRKDGVGTPQYIA